MALYAEIRNLSKNLLENAEEILPDRAARLTEIADAWKAIHQKHGFLRVTAVCTHNSRRSQAMQLWIKVAAEFHKVKHVYSYSGGTEATAFHPHMLTTIERHGFIVEHLDSFPNPHIHIPVSPDDDAMDILYSKKYDESYNPQSAFAALMVCDQAAEACPIVQGALVKHTLPYVDPGAYDEKKDWYDAYQDCFRHIGADMLFVFQKIK